MKTFLKTLAFLAALTLAAALFAGCRSDGGKTVQTTEKPEEPQTYTLRLDSNPTTGFDWTCELSNETVLKLVREDYIQDETDEMMAGVGGTKVFEFAGVSAGEATAVLTYAQGWDMNSVSRTVTLVFEVDADCSVTLKSKSEESRALPEIRNAVIELDSNPTTGYSWTYELSADGIVLEIRDEYIQDDTGELMMGAGGTQVYEFMGVKPGETTAVFTYARPWEENAPAIIRTVEMLVDEDLNVDILRDETKDIPFTDGAEGDGKTAHFELEGNPSTGYMWNYEIGDNTVLAPANESFRPDETEEPVDGAGGVYIFEFRGLEPGETALTFTYSRPGEEADPGSTVTYHITVDDAMNVFSEEMELPMEDTATPGTLIP